MDNLREFNCINIALVPTVRLVKIFNPGVNTFCGGVREEEPQGGEVFFVLCH